MNLKVLCAATAAALLALSSAAYAQTQSGSIVGPMPAPPSTGTSADVAGAAGTTAPRSQTSPDVNSGASTSVGTSGIASGAGPTGPSTGRCDTLIGEERAKCLREQAATGTTPSGTAGAGSTGVGSGAGSSTTR